MRDPAPQGFVDIEVDTEAVNLAVMLGLAVWDPENGVHVLTPKGAAHIRSWCADRLDELGSSHA